MKKQMNKKILMSLLFATFLILSLNMVLSANEASVTISPTSGTNHTKATSPTFNCSSSGSGIVYNILNATFYYNLSGTDTVIGTITNTSSATNSSLTGTISLASVTAGLDYKISCRLSNESNTYEPTINTTKIDFYTSAPTCSFGVDEDTVNYEDGIGVATTQSSTKDALYSLTYAWNLYRSDDTSSTTKTTSAPTFIDGDFDQIGDFKLALTVTDTAGNKAVCANQTITVQGSDNGGVAQTVTTTVGANVGGNKISVTISVLIALLVIMFIAILGYFIIGASKK